MSLEVNIYNLFVNTIALALLIFPIVLIGQLAGADLRPYLNDQLFTVLILFSLIYFFIQKLQNNVCMHHRRCSLEQCSCLHG